MGHKICKKCSKRLLINNFHKQKSSSDGYRDICKSCRKIEGKLRYKNNKDHIDKVNGRWRKDNPTYLKDWWKDNQIHIKQYRQNHKERDSLANKIYRASNIKKFAENDIIPIKRRICSRCKKNRMIKFFNRDRSRNNGIESQCRSCKNLSRRKAVLVRHRERMTTDIQYKLKHVIRSRFSSALAGNYKNGSAIESLGCTIGELKIYLENQFQEGMTWGNHGKYGWHIDHIIPLSSFDLTIKKSINKACHYTNLQPLWAKDNLQKGIKIL